MWRDGVIASFQCPTHLIFGIGAHEKLGDLLRARGARRLLVLLDPALVNSTIHQKVASILAQQDIAAAVFDASDTLDARRQRAADPSGGAAPAALESSRQYGADPSDIVQAALDWRRQHGADGLLAIGGSGTIDMAKAVGELMPSLPLIAIPTTDGAASAVSSACEIAILDPLTVGSMPAQDAAYAGIDAFVHAYESYLSKQATVFSDAVNLQAMTLIAGSIRAFVADRNHESAALDVLCGAALAALDNANDMATFNVAADPERYARIAAILGIEGSGRREAQGGAQVIHGLRALCSDLGIPFESYFELRFDSNDARRRSMALAKRASTT